MRKTSFIVAGVALLNCAPSPPESAEVLVPAGPFRAGANCGVRDAEWSCSNSPVQPRTTIHLDAFYIDRNLATRAAFDKCVAAGACAADGLEPVDAEDLENYGDQAVATWSAYVTLDQARAYCRWRGGRLQHHLEFERIARGTDGRLSPWGDDYRCNHIGGPESETCANAKGPAGARGVAYRRQWVESGTVERYPFGMIMGDSELTYDTANRDVSLLHDDWKPFRFAAIRCSRSAAPATGGQPSPAIPPRSGSAAGVGAYTGSGAAAPP